MTKVHLEIEMPGSYSQASLSLGDLDCTGLVMLDGFAELAFCNV